ncbi:MAG: hypothetical protein GF332_03770 [Candidatus Moranbacteria bacterium]|nr:hypothetical protein [Candidatus Moranbacteria bacterium]
MKKNNQESINQDYKKILNLINKGNSKLSPQEELNCEDNFLSCKLVSLIFGEKIKDKYVNFYFKI